MCGGGGGKESTNFKTHLNYESPSTSVIGTLVNTNLKKKKKIMWYQVSIFLYI